MGDIEAMLREIVRIADDDTIGYSQPDRLGRHNVDCSELMRLGLLAGGWPINYLWTGNMHQELPRVGWTWHPGTDGIQRGDILWKQGHTAAYLGGGQRAEAWIAEDGSIAGRPGDQTGQEVRVHTPWNDITWAGYFRAPADSSTLTGGFLMALSDDQQQEMFDTIREIAAGKAGLRPAGTLRTTINDTYTAARKAADSVTPGEAGVKTAGSLYALTYGLRAEVAALSAAVQAMATGHGLDPQQVTQTITEAVEKALADVQITLTAKEA